MTDYARKMSLDLRMIDENGYSDHIDNKASHCAKMLNDYYRKYDAQKGTQFVFSDLGTYKPGGDFNIYSEIICEKSCMLQMSVKYLVMCEKCYLM